MKPYLAALTLFVIAAPAAAETGSRPYPRIIPAPGGSVVITSPGEQRAYDDYHYAPARRAGDYLYISGVIAGPLADEKTDTDALKAQVRRAFTQLKRTLEAGGARFEDVVMINTFHLWDSPAFSGTRHEQFAAFSAVKDEFIPPPHPAWTAVGTTGLLSDRGVVEIQLVAYVPRRP
jgi:enamine deaminase RidA (YjgF/YER057c/UK114 family)